MTVAELSRSLADWRGRRRARARARRQRNREQQLALWGGPVEAGRVLACSGSIPLTVSSRTSALYLSRRSPSRGWRTAPVIASPRRRPCRRTWASETYTSLGPVR